MKIIFLQDFYKNKFNSIYEFKSGYVRNFLYPENKVLILNNFIKKNLIYIKFLIKKINYIQYYFFFYIYFKYNEIIFVLNSIKCYKSIYNFLFLFFKKKNFYIKRKKIFIKKINNYYKINFKFLNFYLNINFISCIIH